MGQDFQQFRGDVDTAIGAQVGDVQRGEAQAGLATTGTYSGFQQEAARKAAAEQTAKTAQLLAQHKKQQQQGAMARQQAVSAGLQYERNERRKDRQAAMQAVTAVSDMLATHGEVGAEVMGSMPWGAMSSRDVKQGIHYVDPKERKQLADEVLDVKLARYHYIDYIIEDQPEAAFSSGKHVDLYAYVSAVVALVQEQQSEINRLNTRLDTLTKGA